MTIDIFLSAVKEDPGKEKDPSEKLFPNETESPLRAHANILFAVYKAQEINTKDLQLVEDHAGGKQKRLRGWVSYWNKNTRPFFGMPDMLQRKTLLRDFMEMMIISWGENSSKAAGERRKMLQDGTLMLVQEEFEDLMNLRS